MLASRAKRGTCSLRTKRQGVCFCFCFCFFPEKSPFVAGVLVLFLHVQGMLCYVVVITGDHSKQDQILLVKIGKYVGLCVYRRSY